MSASPVAQAPLCATGVSRSPVCLSHLESVSSRLDSRLPDCHLCPLSLLQPSSPGPVSCLQPNSPRVWATLWCARVASSGGAPHCLVTGRRLEATGLLRSTCTSLCYGGGASLI